MKFTKEIVEAIKNFVIDNIQLYPNDISSAVTKHFGITKPTAFKYLNELIRDNIIEKRGKGRYPQYKLKKSCFDISKKISKSLEEDTIWREDVSPRIKEFPENVRAVCQYGFTEMVNNVIDHSEGKTLIINLFIDAKKVEIWVRDDGVGIFNKIKRDLKLADPKFAILELAKGKFTSDPENHTGEGIFFTSRIFDSFKIISDELDFISNRGSEDWLFENKSKRKMKGTTVMMKISKSSTLKIADVFNEFADPDKNPGFHRTVVAVKLMEYEGENLFSRSQAKRLVSRFERFLEVVLDFDEVKSIGQAFADQVFRVFTNAHPKVRLVAINTSKDVQNMIDYVEANKTI